MLTQKERNKVYRKALAEMILKQHNDKRVIGICFHLSNAVRSLYWNKRINGYKLKNWPEMKLFKPTKKEQALMGMEINDKVVGYWYWMWDTPDNYKIRVTILKFCIQMTN